MHPSLKNSLHCAVDNCVRRVPLVLHSGAAGSMLVAGHVGVPGLRKLLTPRPDAPFGAWEEDRGDESATDR